jgi:hypothetical protein
MRTFFSWFSMIIFGLAVLFTLASLSDIGSGRSNAATDLAAAVLVMVLAGILRMLCEICQAVELPTYKVLADMKKAENSSAPAASASRSR